MGKLLRSERRTKLVTKLVSIGPNGKLVILIWLKGKMVIKHPLHVLIRPCLDRELYQSEFMIRNKEKEEGTHVKLPFSQLWSSLYKSGDISLLVTPIKMIPDFLKSLRNSL